MFLKYEIKIFTLFCLAFVTDNYPTLVLNQPITYILGSNLIDPGVNVVQISSSNVIFDLNEYTLAGGLNGIIVDAGLSNVTIRNGNVAQIINSGIVLGQGCNNIEITNMRINQCGLNALQFNTDCKSILFNETIMTVIGQSAVAVPARCSGLRMIDLIVGNCGGNAFSLLGTSSTNPVEDILIESVLTTTCCVLPTFSHVIRVEYGENVVVRDATINNGGNVINDISLIGFTNSAHCSVLDILAIGNCGGGLIGINLINTSSSGFGGVNLFNNCAVSRDFVGFSLTETSVTNFFGFCRVLTCSSTARDAIGFHVASGSDSPSLRNCDAIGLLAARNAIGFNFTGDINNLLEFIILEDCNAVRSVALTGTTIGVEINGADFGSIKDSICSYNRAGSGRSAGLRFSNFSGERWNIAHSNFVRNIGMSNAESFGILVEDSNDGNNLFVQNFAYDNGNTPANQMLGVPAGSVTQLNPSNLNSATSPWANIVVTV